MNNLLGVMDDFISMIDAKFAIATIAMIVIFMAICFLAFLTVTSFQKRRDAIRVQLPTINDHGEVEINEPRFEKDKNLTVELVDPDEDTAEGVVNERNEEAFLATLSMETKTLIISDDSKVDMPVVGEIDYQQIKEDKIKEIENERKARETAKFDYLREVAEADSKEDLSNIEKLNKEMIQSNSSLNNI